jgi:hypothetical protein
MNATARTRTCAARLLGCAAPTRLLANGRKCDPKVRLSAEALFAKGLYARAFKFKPLGFRREFGINE